MVKIIKKIYTILILLTNIMFKHKHYQLTFKAENTEMGKLWYYYFKGWGFNKQNLLMVSGADDLCEYYAEGKNEVTVNIIASKKMLGEKETNDYDMFVGENLNKLTLKEKILYGRNYAQTTADENGELYTKTMWICPVTLFVLGRYPNFLYIKKNENNNKRKS